MILLTDGVDTKSQRKMADGLNLATQSRVIVFTIGLGVDIDRNVLSGIAQMTGGTSLFTPSSAELVTAYKVVADQLRNQYVITHTSPAPTVVKDRRLEIRVNNGLREETALATFTANLPPTAQAVPTSVIETPVKEKATFADRLPEHTPWYLVISLGLAMGLMAIFRTSGLTWEKWRSQICPDCGVRYPKGKQCPLCQLNAQDHPKRLGEILVESKLITAQNLEAALERSLEEEKRLGEVLIDMGFIDGATLRRALFYQSRSSDMTTRKERVMVEDFPGPITLRSFLPYIAALAAAFIIVAVAIPHF
ncbi:MAG: hypothetical protein HY664_02495 [Chloroflexi bacterium]|nr:hypothetical protein [Chloroflexota bacterium]